MPKKANTARPPIKRPNVPQGGARSVANGGPRAAQQKASPVTNKAYSVAGGEQSGGGVSGAYAIMASRIANRVAEMAEGITFVER